LLASFIIITSICCMEDSNCIYSTNASICKFLCYNFGI